MMESSSVLSQPTTSHFVPFYLISVLVTDKNQHNRISPTVIFSAVVIAECQGQYTGFHCPRF